MNTFHLGSCDDYTNSRPSRWDFRHRHYVRPLYAYPVGIRKADFVRQARTSHYTLNTWYPTISQAAFRHCPSYGFVRQAVAVFTILTTDAPIVIATERAILVRPRHRHATNYAIGHESDFMLSHWLREQPHTFGWLSAHTAGRRVYCGHMARFRYVSPRTVLFSAYR